VTVSGGPPLAGAIEPAIGASEQWRRIMASLAHRSVRHPIGYVGLLRRLLMRFGLPIAAVIVLTMIFLDASVHRLVSMLPGWFVALGEEVSDYGRSAFVLVPVGALIVLVAFLASRATERMSRAVLAMVAVRLAFVFAAVGLPGLTVTIVKRWIGRVRPSAQGPFAYEPLSWNPGDASLPSGHATTAFAALVAIGAIFPRLRPVLWLYALLVAASRVVVSAHYPSDAIAGAAAGAAGALLVREWFARRRLGFFIARDGAVHAKPGPSRRRIERVAGALVAP
jgi:membrane-associated phospholipid phosphatase